MSLCFDSDSVGVHPQHGALLLISYVIFLCGVNHNKKKGTFKWCFTLTVSIVLASASAKIKCLHMRKCSPKQLTSFKTCIDIKIKLCLWKHHNKG